MTKKISYTNEPLGEVEVIRDFLPAPSEPAFCEEGVKVTLAPSKSSVDFFKLEASKHQTQYQRMIRRLLDSYIETHSPPATKVYTKRTAQKRAAAQQTSRGRNAIDISPRSGTYTNFTHDDQSQMQPDPLKALFNQQAGSDEHQSSNWRRFEMAFTCSWSRSSTNQPPMRRFSAFGRAQPADDHPCQTISSLNFHGGEVMEDEIGQHGRALTNRVKVAGC